MKKIIFCAIMALMGLSTAWAATPKSQPVNPRGLFKLQKLTYDDPNTEAKTPLNDQYKYCGEGGTMQIYILPMPYLSFTMQNVDKKPLNYTGKIKDSKETQIYDTSKDAFTLRWFNTTVFNNSYFPYAEYINELYTREGMNQSLVTAMNMLKLNFNVKANKFCGAWKRRGTLQKADDMSTLQKADAMYKIYSASNCLIIQQITEEKDKEAAQCQMADVKYGDGKTISEGKNSCEITWIDDNSFILKWNYNLEVWDRAEIPSAFQPFFNTQKTTTNTARKIVK